jgi:hypothetical protein
MHTVFCRVNVLGRPRHRCELGYAKMGIKEMLWEGVEQIRLAEDGDKWRAVVETVSNLLVQYSAGDFLTSQRTITVSR